MNFIKAEEYAKTLPIGMLKEYADGKDPSMIPQWVATGVMESKIRQAQLVDNMQAAKAANAPDVKNQIEQKAGLLALQQAQQMQQAQQARPMPGPVPEGAPQPKPQPQPGEAMPETFMAAGGGLARLPSHLRFDGGGIVAFAGPTGSEVKAGPDFMRFLRQMGIDYVEFSQMAPEIQNNIKDAFRETGGARPAAAAPAAAAPAAQAAAEGRGLLYGAGKLAGKAVKGAGLPGALASTVENFGDYKLKSDNNIDTSASGTYNDLKRGEFGRAAKGLGMGLLEAGADLGSAAANTLDYVVPGKAPVSSAYDRLLRSTGAFKDNQAPQAQPNDQSAAETQRLLNTAPAVPLGNEGRRSGPVGVGINANINPNLIPANLRPAAKPNAGPAGPAGPAAPAAPTGPAPGSAQALAMEAVQNKEKPMTLEEAIAERRKAEAAFGLDKPAGLEKLARIKEMDERFKATQPDAIDNLIRTFSRAGQFKGLSGTGSAYTATQEENRARELAHLKDLNTLYGGVEDTQRAEATAGMTGATATLDKSKQQANELNKERMQTLASMAGNESHERTAKYTADMHYKAAMAQAAMADRRADAAEKRAIIDSFKLRINSINAELVPLEKNPFLKENKVKIEQLRAEKEGLNKALDEHSGISKMTPTPGAGSPGGTKPGWGQAQVIKQ